MVMVNLILGSVVILKINEYSVAGKTIPIALTVLVFCVFIIVMPRGDYFKSKAAQITEQKIYYYREGSGGTVTVHGYELGYKALSINGALLPIIRSTIFALTGCWDICPIFFSLILPGYWSSGMEWGSPPVVSGMMTLDSFMLLRFVPLFSKLHPCGFLT
jgi:hypothetical protein